MRWTKSLVVGVLLLWAVGACLKQPEYSIVPNITLQSVTFKRGNLAQQIQDTLIFVLKFSDGDGDLGINGDETAIYNGSDSVDIDSPFFFIYDTLTNNILYYSHQSDLALSNYGKNLSYVNFKTKRTRSTISPYDTMPAYNCRYWEIIQRQVNSSSVSDTLFFVTNEKSYNFLVNAYEKVGGTYNYYDPAVHICQPNLLNYRFPVLSTDLGKKAPLDGTITCKIPSYGLYLIFHGKTMRFNIWITDRAFHKSNAVIADYTF